MEITDCGGSARGTNMKTIRIFISSPGDVAEERDRARQVVEQLRRRYAGQFDLKAVLWEDLPLQPDMSFQQGIDLVLTGERGIDVAVFILWSRLGTPTGALVQNPRRGEPYRSGTDREFDLMQQARADARERVGRGELDRVRPDILVYTRKDEASFDERLRGKPTDEKNRLLAQKKLVETFIAEEFHDAASGANIRAYHSFDQPVTFSQRLRTHLQEILDGFGSGLSGEPVWDTASLGSPFRGLEAFEFGHSPVFFGREDEVLEVRRALQRKACEGCAFVLISGASGSGKSSLARAGVIPAVVEYEVDGTVSGWRYAVCSPAQFAGDLCGGLARLLCSPDVLPELRLSDDSVSVLSEGLSDAPKATVDQSLRPALARASHGQPGTTRLLLLVDQLEELFTDKRLSDADRDRFLAALEALARSGAVWVLATVRSDFYQQCQRLPALMRLKEGPGQIDLLPATADALRRLIEQPARLACLGFEVRDGKALADRILTDAAAHAELLPLVSYVLRELYEQRTPSGELTFAAYDQLGGVEGALAKRAESVFGSLPAAAQVELSAVLRALVSVSGDEEESVVRQHVALSLFSLESPARALVDRFVTERFLVTGKGADGTGTVAVAHEALLRAWSRAAQWIADNREFLRVRARVATRMKEGSRLLEGDPLLDAARHQLAALPSGFTPEQRIFIEESIAEVARKKRRSRRIRNTVMTGLSVLTLVTAWQWHRANASRRQAEQARDEAVTARDQAENLIDFMSYNLHRKLESVGNLNLIDDINQAVESYHQQRERLMKFRGDVLSDRELQRRAISYVNRGDLRKEQGNLAEAEKHYRKALEIEETLAACHPVNPLYQRDLSLIHNRLGEFMMASGNLAEAEKHYRKDLEIAESIVVRYPVSTTYQHDLSLSHNNLGKFMMSTGNQTEAKKHYCKALEIAETIAVHDPGNTDSQRDRYFSHFSLGRAFTVTGDLTWAEKHYRKALEIAETLSASDPSNANWQRSVSVCHSALGDSLKATDNLIEAEKHYRKALEIRETLAARDPDNAQWQRDLSASHNKLGAFMKATGNQPEAEKHDRKVLGIAETLAARDPNNADWQRDLFVSYFEMAGFEEQQDAEKARGWWSKAHEQLLGMKRRGIMQPTDEQFIELTKKKAEQ